MCADSGNRPCREPFGRLVNLTEPILRHARMQPDAAALIEGDRTINYAMLADHVLRTAGHLAALGVGQGDQVGLCLKDDSAHVATMLAVLGLGAVAVPIDWRSRPAEKTRVAHAFAFKLVVTTADGIIDAPHATAALDDAVHKAVAASSPTDHVPDDWHAPAVVSASSGTTGLPKFTVATHLQVYLHAAAFLEIVPET